MSNKRVALIGVGNIMFCDEGIGAYALRYIEKNYEIPKNLTLVEGSSLGFSMMTYYHEYDKIIVLGTGSDEGEAGLIKCEDADTILSKGPVRKTANEVEITMMIEICSFHENMGEVTLVTMVPEDIVSVRNGLTKTTLANMPDFVQKVLEVLKAEGFELQQKENLCSFEEIIEEFSNPKQTFDPQMLKG